MNRPALLRGDEQIVAHHRALDAEPLEAHARRAQMLDAGAHDAELGARDCGESDERSDLDVIRTDAVRGAMQRLRAVDGERVRADPLDAGAHRDEESREILHVRLARRVADASSYRGRCSRP